MSEQANFFFFGIVSFRVIHILKHSWRRLVGFMEGPFAQWVIDTLVQSFGCDYSAAAELTRRLTSAADAQLSDIDWFLSMFDGLAEDKARFRKALVAKMFSDGTDRKSNKVTVSLSDFRRHAATLSSSKEPGSKKTKKSIKRKSLIAWNPYDIDVMSGEREMCDCQGRAHQFVGSCMNCGRVVCAAEKVGPCLFCGDRVHAADHVPEDLLLIPSFAEALRRRNVLLGNDRASGSVSQIVDDETDYFQVQSSAWKSDEEKMKLREKTERQAREAEMARKFRYVSIDLSTGLMGSVQQDESLYCDVGEDYGEKPFPVDSSVQICKDHGLLKGGNEENLVLSMHQPWASLLVQNVKHVEGRSWQTPYRGWVWIASTGTVADAREVDDVLQMYKSLRGSHCLEGLSYPTSRLLGCAFLEDVLTTEQYHQSTDPSVYESEAPFVWVFRPDRWIIHDPPKISGHPKLWTLSSHQLEGLLKGRRVESCTP